MGFPHSICGSWSHMEPWVELDGMTYCQPLRGGVVWDESTATATRSPAFIPIVRLTYHSWSTLNEGFWCFTYLVMPHVTLWWTDFLASSCALLQNEWPVQIILGVPIHIMALLVDPACSLRLRMKLVNTHKSCFPLPCWSCSPQLDIRSWKKNNVQWLKIKDW